MRALIVDDSRAMRTVLGQILSELEFEVVDACDGVEAVERLATSGAIDLALVDWHMPRMDGLELVRRLRARARPTSGSPLRILMVTAEDEMTQVMAALDAGVDEYLRKPFSKDVLREKLELLGLVRPA